MLTLALTSAVWGACAIGLVTVAAMLRHRGESYWLPVLWAIACGMMTLLNLLQMGGW